MERDNEEVVYVLAGSFAQARRFFDDLKVPAKRRCYVHDSYQLAGVRGGKLYLVGTYAENRDFLEIFDLAKSRGFEIRYETPRRRS